MREPTIRPSIGAGEHPTLVAIWRRAVDATHDFLAEDDRNRIEASLAAEYFPAVVLLVAELDDEPVGFAGTRERSLEMLFVDPDVRGAGIGTALLTRAIAEHGVTTVAVNEQNASALRFYEHRGFDIVSRRETDEAGRPYPLLLLRLGAAS